MEIYAAMIANIDHHLGRLFGYLKKSGQWDNTLVIFFSDNGANGLQMHQYPHTDEAWSSGTLITELRTLDASIHESRPVQAEAQVSMTPFRMFKHFVAEGGIRSPLIISGPGVENPGTRSDAFSHIMRYTASTILEASQTPHPGTTYKGREIVAAARQVHVGCTQREGQGGS